MFQLCLVSYSSIFAFCEVDNMADYDIINTKSRDEWLVLIYQWVHNEVDRKMLERKLLDGICFEPLAEEFEMSVNHCQARIKKAKAQLFKHC